MCAPIQSTSGRMMGASPHLADSESLARTRAVAQGTLREGSRLLLEKILECQQNAKQLDLVKFVCVGFEPNANLSIFEDQQSQMLTFAFATMKMLNEVRAQKEEESIFVSDSNHIPKRTSEANEFHARIGHKRDAATHSTTALTERR
ncbi:hypothetical protein V9T40_001404 [Parthenolecanium corni]|uniref:Uncharacterized protein n=1 Tax=Parthenolecanium corni TaxID=536013 RepID=A0AAN9TDF0_9HEMI